MNNVRSRGTGIVGIVVFFVWCFAVTGAPEGGGAAAAAGGAGRDDPFAFEAPTAELGEAPTAPWEPEVRVAPAGPAPLVVSGIIQVGDVPSAIVNDTIVGVGSTVAGRTVLAIEPDRVVFGADERQADERQEVVRFGVEGPARAGAASATGVTLNVRDGDIRDVLRTIMQQVDVNLAITDAVKGTTTIRMRDVPPDRALGAIVATAGLAIRREPDLITVMAPSGEPAPVEKAAPRVQMNTRVLSFRFAKAEPILDAFKAQLSPNGKIGLAKDSNALIITDLADVLDRLSAFAAEIDSVPQAVMIDVVIADTVVHTGKESGVSLWLGKTNPTMRTGSLKTSTDLELAKTSSQTTTADNPLVLGQLFSKTAAGALSYQLLDKNWTVDTFVRALQEDADARILASPRILALSGLKASIETTEEIPYQQLTQTSEGGQIGTTAFKDAGVKLHVTPRVTGAGAIVLEVKAEQSAETGRVVGDIPVVSKHVAETTLLVNSGESVIMGGLRRTVNTKTRTQIPVLGDIPILGWPFRHTKTGQETRDLVVFLTPRLSSPAAQPRPGNMQGARNGEEQRPPQIVLPPGFK